MDVSSARSENRANSFNVIFYLSSANPVFSIFSLQRQIITLRVKTSQIKWLLPAHATLDTRIWKQDGLII